MKAMTTNVPTKTKCVERQPLRSYCRNLSDGERLTHIQNNSYEPACLKSHFDTVESETDQ